MVRGRRPEEARRVVSVPWRRPAPAILLRLVAAGWAVAAALVPASCRDRGDSGSGAAPATTPATAREALTAADLEMFLAVRGKALSRLEEEVTAAEKPGGSLLGLVVDLSVAEQDAAAALGFTWRRYRWVREEVARLLAVQRQRDDAELLTLELGRARDDLHAQISAARDPASRQFLEAQVASLDAQLAKLAEGREPTPGEAKGLALIGSARAELAVQQGRQERIARRLRDLVQRERAGVAPTPSQ